MKKIILSLLIIGTFGFYILFQRSGSPTDLALNDVPAEIYPATSTAPSSPILVTAGPATTSVKKVIKKTPSPTPSPAPTPTPTPTPVPSPRENDLYKDGNYTGVSANAYYGYVQVKAVISDGRLADVQFLNYPHDRSTSVRINGRALPILRSEAISAQDANIHTVSGATDSSGAFRQSLASALNQAKNG